MPRTKTRRKMSNEELGHEMLCAVLYEPLFTLLTQSSVKSTLLTNPFCSSFLFGHIVQCIILLQDH